MKLAFSKPLAQQFLTALDPSVTVFTFQCFHPDKTLEAKKKFPPSRIIHSTLDKIWDTLVSYNKKGYGVYICVNETDGRGRTINNITNVRAVWQEDDEGWEGKLPLKPNLVVKTSAGKFHRYWLLEKEPVEKPLFDSINRVLVQEYGSDKNAKDLARVLRLPGLYNTKKSGEDTSLWEKVTIEDQKPGRYNIEKIVKKFNVKSNGNGTGNIFPGYGEYKESDFNFLEYARKIKEAEEYYQPLLGLSMFFAGSGFTKNKIVKTLRDLLLEGRENDKNFHIGDNASIWEDRFNSVPQMAQSALDKVKGEATVRGGMGAFTDSIADVTPAGIWEITNAEYKPIKYVINPIIPEESISMIHSKRGVGKTYFALSLGMAIAFGIPFLKWSNLKKKRVLYVDGELTSQRLQEQIRSSIDGLKLGSDVMKANPTNIQFIYPDVFPNKIFPDITGNTSFNIIAQNDMFDKIIEKNADVIIFDSLATVFKRAEDKLEYYKPVQQFLLRLRSHGKTVILIHHDGKDGNQRGGSNKEDVMDTVIHLVNPYDKKGCGGGEEDIIGRDGEGCKFNVMFSKSRGFGGDDIIPFGVSLEFPSNLRMDHKWNYGVPWGGNRELVLFYFKSGKIANWIASELGITKVAISKHKKRLIADGKLTEEECHDGRGGLREKMDFNGE